MVGIDFLAEKELKAKAATPGPWANTDNVKELFGQDPIDWWYIYAEDESLSCAPISVCRVTGHATDEEERESRRKRFRHGRMKDPGQGGRNAAYIAAVDPGTVRLLIDAIRTLGRYLEEEGMPQEVAHGDISTVASLQATDWINKAFDEVQENMEPAK